LVCGICERRVVDCLCMLATDSLWVSRMWEIHKSGLMRAKATALPGLRYSTVIRGWNFHFTCNGYCESAM